MIQSPQPAVGDGGHDDVVWFPFPLETAGGAAPVRAVGPLPSGRLTQRGPESLVARLDQARLRHFLSTGGDATCHAAVTGELFAVGNAFEGCDLCSHRDGRD